MTETLTVAFDDVHRPKHYNSHPSGVEVKEITGEMLCPHLANSVKYVCRFPLKDNPLQDLSKAREYVFFELHRRWDHGTYESPARYEQPRYHPEYAAFYRYVAAETNSTVRELLVKVWNADKQDGEDAEKLLSAAIRILENMIDAEQRRIEVAERQRVEVGVKLLDAEQESKPVRRGLVAKRAAKEIVGLVDEGDEILVADGDHDGWHSISGIRRTRGGIVWITVPSFDEEIRLKPSQEVTVRIYNKSQSELEN